MSLEILTKQNFDDIVANNDIVLIDFWAQWCQPCLAFAEIYEKCAVQHDDVVFGKVNVEEETELAADFQIRSIPQLLVIRQSVVVYAESGTLPESALNDLIVQAKGLDMDAVKKDLLEE